MKRFLLLCTILCLSALSGAAVSPTVIAAHKAAHKIIILDISGGSEGSCSATAIGPHALLTATHCSSPSAVITIDGKDADVMGTIGDGLDHTIVLVRGVEFKDYADVAEVVNVPVAEDVFVFGNPGPFPDMYRKGYVSGIKGDEDAPETPIQVLTRPQVKRGNENVRISYYDFNGFFGDSGSAIFNNDGKIIAVTSFIVGGEANGFPLKFMGSYELRLSKEQLQQARNYNPPAAPVPPPAKDKKHKSFFDLFSNEDGNN